MSKGISNSQVLEITQCVICKESFKEPKVLPCIHTFCLHCLEKYGKEKEKDSGDKLDCALCRKEFVIPQGGFRELPNNYFIIQLMQLEQSSRSDSREQSVFCDWCSELNEKLPATVYCIECKEHLCQPCRTKHAKPKARKDHEVVSLKDKPSAEQLIKMVPSYCEKHPSKEIEFYCSDCKMVFCYVCGYVAQHNKHKCCDLNESAETLSKQLKSDLDRLSPYILRNKSEMKQIEEKKTTVIQKVTAAKGEIMKRYDSLKSLLESHHIQLMSELNEFEKEALKELETRKEEVEKQSVILDSYKKYCEELKEKGTACEISCAANDLRTRAVDLVKAQEEFMTNGGLLEIDIKFTPSLTATDSVRNWLGQLVLFKGEDPSFFLVAQCHNIVSNGIYRISLTEIDMMSTMTDIPTKLNIESRACNHGNSIYVTGTSRKCPHNETWRLDLLSNHWFRCANMLTGRRRHCAIIFDSQLYMLGGWDEENTLSSVESYNIDTNTWSASGNLIHAVHNAACISYNNSIYVFGGICSKETVTHVQVYDPTSQSCRVLKSPIPGKYWLMRAAVLWETSIILMHRDTCLLYNFETQTWLERKQFKTNLLCFGLVLKNQTIYIAGGGMYVKDKDNKDIWTYMDEVKSMSVLDIIEDKPVATWMLHAILPKPGSIDAYCMCPFMQTNK